MGPVLNLEGENWGTAGAGAASVGVQGKGGSGPGQGWGTSRGSARTLN